MQISLLYGLLQPHKIVAGLGHINVDRIELLDSRQFSRLPISDKSAFGHSRFADTSANWRSHFGISEIDASAFDCGFCGNHGGIGLASISNGLVVLLLTDVFRTHERNVTFYRQMRDGGGGFTFRQFAFRAVITCLIGRGIDLVQRLACLHIAAFSEIATQYDPANLWANFGYTVSIGAAW